MKRSIWFLMFILPGLTFGATVPFAASWINGPQSNAVYRSSAFPKAIFVAVFTCNDLDVNSKSCSYNEQFENELATKYTGNPNVQILDFENEESQDGMKQFIASNHINHPVLIDEGGKLLGQVLQLGFLELAFPPLTYVFSPQGEVLYATHFIWNQPSLEDGHVTVMESIDQLIKKHLGL